MSDVFMAETPEEKLADIQETLRVDVQFNIQRAMKQKRITQKHIAETLGCSPANVSKMFKEGARLPVDTIGKLCFAVGVQPVFHIKEAKI